MHCANLMFCGVRIFRVVNGPSRWRGRKTVAVSRPGRQQTVGMSKPGSVAHRDVQKLLVQAALVFAAYYIAGMLGHATTHIRSSNLGPVWPAFGVALAAVLWCGYRIWPALLAAAVAVALQSPVP